jgi:hypothetical protein
MFGDTEAVVDRGGATGCVETGGVTQIGSRHAGDRLHRFRRVALFRDERGPAAESVKVAALADVLLVHQVLRHDDVGHGVDYGHVSTR